MAFSLKKYNTFGLEVEATWGIEINDFVMFDMAFKKIKETGLPFIVLGDGSDVLFKEDYEGIVMVNRLKGMEFSRRGRILIQ